MSGKKMDKKRVLDYVGGLLYFYGVMDFESLFRALQENLSQDLDRDNFLVLAEEELGGFFGDYEFEYDEGLFMLLDVEEVEWVLKEQKSRGDIPYRLVSEKEARLVAEGRYSSLWHQPVKKLYDRLVQEYQWTPEDALARIEYTQHILQNGTPVMEMTKDFIEDMEFENMENVQSFVTTIQDMANHTPLWILKGWTPHEIFMKHEKPHLRPLPDEPFPLQDLGSQDRQDDKGGKGGKGGQKVSPKLGRNEPCPCGSQKKYKKCCGAPVVEAEDKKPAFLGQQITASDRAQKSWKKEKKERDADNPAPATAPVKEPVQGPTREPSLEEWRELYKAADAFKKAKCWEWMYDNELFGVMDPETKEIAYCCIMGWLGEVFALGAYLGEEGLDSLQDIWAGEDEHSPDLFFQQKCLMASFEDHVYLDDQDRALIKELGLKYRGEKQWPMFRSLEPGLHPWFLSAWECRFLTRTLEQALEVALRCRSDKSILEHPDERTFLVRVPQVRDGYEIIWEDQYLQAAEVAKEFPVVEIRDELRLKKILSTVRKGKRYWEVDTFLFPFPIQEQQGERPYHAKIFLVVDSSSCMVLSHETVKNLEEGSQSILEVLLQLIEADNVGMPLSIVVERDETYHLLSKACEQLQLPLEKVKQLQVIPELREELFNRDCNRNSQSD